MNLTMCHAMDTIHFRAEDCGNNFRGVVMEEKTVTFLSVTKLDTKRHIERDCFSFYEI